MKRRTSMVALTLVILLLGLATLAAQKPDPAAKGTTSDAPMSAKKPNKPVDINNASEKELMTLPGVGPKIAKEIVASRPFQSIDDLKKVKGVGDKTFDKLKAHVLCNPPKK